MLAAESDERRFGAAGGDERGGKLRHARAAGRGGDARGVRRARLAVGHAEPRAFVAHLVHLDAAELVERVHPVHVAVAHHAEDVRRCLRALKLAASLWYTFILPVFR